MQARMQHSSMHGCGEIFDEKFHSSKYGRKEKRINTGKNKQEKPGFAWFSIPRYNKLSMSSACISSIQQAVNVISLRIKYEHCSYLIRRLMTLTACCIVQHCSYLIRRLMTLTACCIVGLRTMQPAWFSIPRYNKLSMSSACVSSIQLYRGIENHAAFSSLFFPAFVHFSFLPYFEE